MIAPDAAPLAFALLGLTLGMRHATDPDHVIAVTTIVSRERSIAAAGKIGLAWGLGHTVTMVAVGGAIIGFKIEVPVRFGLAMEFAVATVLILLGISTMRAVGSSWLRRAPSRADHVPLVHTHSHVHHGIVHSHPHAHRGGLDAPETSSHEHLFSTEPAGSRPARWPFARAFGVGLVHGLAGSAAIALLVLAAIPDPLWGVLYLAVFGLGTILGMMIVTTAIGAPISLAAERTVRFHSALAVGSGLLSFGFGLFLAYQIGIVDGLFRASAAWTPH